MSDVSSSRGIIETLQRRNAQAPAPGPLPQRPTLEVAVVACMDCRIDVYATLGLSPGEAHVIRNAGARAVDALRSIVVSQRKLGTREVMLIAHTDCGMATFTSDDLRDELGPDAADLDFLTFDAVERMVADDTAWLAAHPLLLPGTTVRGFVLDIETGKLSEV